MHLTRPNNSEGYEIVGIGQAFTDSICNVSHAFLNQYGIPLNAGVTLPEDTLFEIRDHAGDYELIPGGAVANTTAGLSFLGVRVGFWGKVADDDEGHSFANALQSRNVDMLCSAKKISTKASANCLVLITPDGSRSFVTSDGCSLDYEPNDFTDFDFSQTRFLIIESKILPHSSPASIILPVAQQAKSHGCRIVFSLTNLSNWDHAAIPDIIVDSADMIVGNNTEVDALRNASTKTINNQCVLVTTLGADGASILLDGQETRVTSKTPRRFTNSLGAGDQFLAGFLAGLVRGHSTNRSAEIAVSCATSILEEAGARPSANCDWASLLVA